MYKLVAEAVDGGEQVGLVARPAGDGAAGEVEADAHGQELGEQEQRLEDHDGNGAGDATSNT